jgi:hypothetical protein
MAASADVACVVAEPVPGTAAPAVPAELPVLVPGTSASAADVPVLVPDTRVLPFPAGPATPAGVVEVTPGTSAPPVAAVVAPLPVLLAVGLAGLDPVLPVLPVAGEVAGLDPAALVLLVPVRSVPGPSPRVAPAEPFWPNGREPCDTWMWPRRRWRPVSRRP